MFVNHAVVGTATQLRLNNRPEQADATAFKLLLAMDSSTTEYYLTGSRFFGTAHERSDWDFFTKDSPTTRQWLTNNSFCELAIPPYVTESAQEIATVMMFPRKEVIDEAMKSFNIFDSGLFDLHPLEHGVPTVLQVQLIQNVDLKNRIQIALSLNTELLTALTGKWVARSIWEAAFIGAKA